jgi:presenilin-like A22 family membrane protease
MTTSDPNQAKQNENGVSLPLRTIEYRQQLQILVLFLIVQFGGLLLGTLALRGTPFSYLKSNQSAIVGNGAVGILFYVASIAAFALILALIFKLYKGRKFFLILEGIIVFISSIFVFLVIIGTVTGNTQQLIFGNGPLLEVLAAAAASFLLIIIKNRWQRLRNVTVIISSMGAGLVLGLFFTFPMALIFMGLLAVYDFVAVFITKHMITISNAAMTNNLAFFIDANELEAVPKSSLTRKEQIEYRKIRGKIESRFPAIQEYEKRNMVPIVANIGLGNGDLGVPLMVSLAAYSMTANFALSLSVTAGATLGLIVTMLILRRYKRALPAIPPLLLGVLVGVGAYYLLLRI